MLDKITKCGNNQRGRQQIKKHMKRQQKKTGIWVLLCRKLETRHAAGVYVWKSL